MRRRARVLTVLATTLLGGALTIAAAPGLKEGALVLGGAGLLVGTAGQWGGAVLIAPGVTLLVAEQVVCALRPGDSPGRVVASAAGLYLFAELCWYGLSLRRTARIERLDPDRRFALVAAGSLAGGAALAAAVHVGRHVLLEAPALVARGAGAVLGAALIVLAVRSRRDPSPSEVSPERD